MGAFRQWRVYCTKHDLKCWLASPEDVLGYLHSLSRRLRGCTQATVYLHLSAIAYFYRLKQLPSPTLSPIVTMFMKSLKRRELQACKRPKQASPMTREILRQLNSLVRKPRCSLRIWRNVWRINVAFYGLLRWDDVRRLKVSEALLCRGCCTSIQNYIMKSRIFQVSHFQFRDTSTGPQYVFELQGGKTLMYEKDLSR